MTEIIEAIELVFSYQYKQKSSQMSYLDIKLKDYSKEALIYILTEMLVEGSLLEKTVKCQIGTGGQNEG